MSLRQAHQHVKESDTKHNCCSIKGLQLDNLPTLLGQILWAPAGVSFLFHIRKVTLNKTRLFGFIARSNSCCSRCHRYTEIFIHYFLFSFHQFWNVQVFDASTCIFFVPFCSVFGQLSFAYLWPLFFFVSCSDFYSKLLFCCQGINLISYYIIEVGIHWKTLWTTFHLFCSLFIDNIYFKIRHSDFNYS